MYTPVRESAINVSVSPSLWRSFLSYLSIAYVILTSASCDDPRVRDNPNYFCERAFFGRGCGECHSSESSIAPPVLGARIRLGDVRENKQGETRVVDKEYIRESIVNHGAFVISGYESMVVPVPGELDNRARDADIIVPFLLGEDCPMTRAPLLD